MKSSGTQIELIERLGSTVKELYDLLEQYAPAWYSKELHDRVEASAKLVPKANGRNGHPPDPHSRGNHGSQQGQ